MPPLDVLDRCMAADEQDRHSSDVVTDPADARLASGALDPAGPIWQDGAFRRDTWVKADATSPLPDGAVLLPKKRWLAERDQLAARNTPLGLIIAAGEKMDDIADGLSRFALIALDFPKFSDGRAYSTARLMREKYGYTGELRAVGNVLADRDPPDAPRRLRFLRGDERADPPRSDRGPACRGEAALSACHGRRTTRRHAAVA